MRLIIARAAVALAALTGLIAESAQSGTPDDLLIHYSFNEGRGAAAIDHTGYGADAVLFGGASYVGNDATGGAKFGHALHLDGSGYLVMDSTFHSRRADAQAASLWVNPDSVTDPQQRYLVSRMARSEAAGLALSITQGKLVGEVYLDYFGLRTVVSRSRIDGWTHAALALDSASGKLKLYINGRLDNTVAVPINSVIRQTAAPLTIGALSGSPPTDRFTGRIDDLRLYQRFNDVLAAQLATAPGGEPGLLFYESFDSVAALGATGALVTTGLTDADDTVAGRLGNALHLQDDAGELEQLSWPTAGRMNPHAGQISFWYRPDYAADTPDSSTFLETGDRGAGAGLRVYRCANCSIWPNEFRVRIHGKYLTSTQQEPAVTQSWQPGEWHKIDVVWDTRSNIAEQRYVAYLVDGIITEMLTGVATAGGTTAESLHVGSSKAYAGMRGSIDELKIYAEPRFDMLGDVDEKIALLRDGTRADNELQPWESVYDSADARLPEQTEEAAAWQNRDPVSFFDKGAFARVYPGYLPAVAELSDHLYFTAARNDNQSLFFNVYSQVDADDVQLIAGDLRDSGGNVVVPATEITVRSVKNWWQRSADDRANRLPYFPVWVPELLMFDDRINFRYDDYDAGPVRIYSRNNLPSDAPPPGAHAETYLRAWTSKQFMAGIKIPATAPPGDYMMPVRLLAPAANVDRIVRLYVRVHDFVLPEADKDFMIYHRSQYLDPRGSDDLISRDQYMNELHDILDHGFNGIHVYGKEIDYIDDLLEAGQANDNGAFTGKVLYKGIYATAELSGALTQAFGAAWYTSVDEPESVAELMDLKISAARIHAAGGRVGTAIYLHWADCLNSPRRHRPHPDFSSPVNFCPDYVGAEVDPQETLDLENLSVNDAVDSLWEWPLSVSPTQNYFASILNNIETKDSALQTYYWQSRTEDPRINRYYAGTHLYLTDMAGVWPYAYKHINGSDPYNDFDVPVPLIRTERDMNTVYPTQQGSMTTIQWEALREGIDDYRHLQLWESLMEEQLSTNAAAAYRSRNRLEYDPETGIGLWMFRYRPGDGSSGSNLNPLVTTRDFETFRSIVADEILMLRSGLTLDLSDPDFDGIPTATEEAAGSDPLDIYSPLEAGLNISPLPDFVDASIADEGRTFDRGDNVYVILWNLGFNFRKLSADESLLRIGDALTVQLDCSAQPVCTAVIGPLDIPPGEYALSATLARTTGAPYTDGYTIIVR